MPEKRKYKKRATKPYKYNDFKDTNYYNMEIGELSETENALELEIQKIEFEVQWGNGVHNTLLEDKKNHFKRELFKIQKLIEEK